MIKAYINKINGNTKLYEFEKPIIYTEKLTKQIDNITKNYYQLCINTDTIYDYLIDNKYEFSQDIIYNIKSKISSIYNR